MRPHMAVGWAARRRAQDGSAFKTEAQTARVHSQQASMHVSSMGVQFINQNSEKSDSGFGRRHRYRSPLDAEGFTAAANEDGTQHALRCQH